MFLSSVNLKSAERYRYSAWTEKTTSLYKKKSVPVKFNILHRTLTTCAQRYKTL